MTKNPAKSAKRKGVTPFGVISLLLGLALFGYFIKKAGFNEILDGIRRLGAGFLVSEPAKPALIRDRVPLIAGFSALAIENLFYALSVALFIFAGMVAFLLSFTLPKGLRLISIITMAIIAVVIALGILLITRRLRFI